MAWPTPQEYNEAIQSPRLAFADPELQCGEPEITKLGLPRPITGNFASVYRLRCARKDWAVRCFWRELADMQQRYAAISHQLRQHPLPYMVGFEYQPRGIKVHGAWYPILKMEWVEGELLHEYLASNRRNPAALRSLAGRWLAMSADLERADCAHGDLQHGNVIVQGGEIKLVDYDGMYVPALKGRASPELGHQNFQHPHRTASDFGPYLDRFAARTIYLSIIALQETPDLWDETGAGDDCLLFHRADFSDPSTSRLFSRLEAHAGREVREEAAQLRAALDTSVRSIRSLQAGRQVNAGAARGKGPPSSRLVLTTELIRQSIAPGIREDECDQEPPAVARHPAWLVDYVVREAGTWGPVSCPHVRTIRVWSAALLAADLPFVLGGRPFSLPFPVQLVTAGLLLLIAEMLLAIVTYWLRPDVRALSPLARRRARMRLRLAHLRRRSEALHHRVHLLARLDEAGEEQARRRKAELSAKEERERRDAVDALSRAVAGLEERSRRIDDRQTAELQSALEQLQRSHVSTMLRRESVRRANLGRGGWRLKARLWALGVWAAADVTSERIAAIRGMAHDDLLAVVGWRVDAERAARRSMPSQLPPDRSRPIRARYDAERAAVRRRHVQEQTRTEQTLVAIGRRYQRRYRKVDSRCRAGTQQRDVRRAEVQALISSLCAEQERYEAAGAAVERAVRPFRGVTLANHLLALCGQRARAGQVPTSIQNDQRA